MLIPYIGLEKGKQQKSSGHITPGKTVCLDRENLLSTSVIAIVSVEYKLIHTLWINR